jgi:hypothetical protein
MMNLYNDFEPRFQITAVTQSSAKIPLDLDFNGYVIDARLRTSGTKLPQWKNYGFFREQDLFEDESSVLFSSDIKYYLPEFEFRSPETTFLSTSWRRFVARVSELGPTFLITEPLQSNNSDSYLTSILAKELIYL